MVFLVEVNDLDGSLVVIIMFTKNISLAKEYILVIIFLICSAGSVIHFVQGLVFRQSNLSRTVEKFKNVGTILLSLEMTN